MLVADTVVEDEVLEINVKASRLVLSVSFRVDVELLEMVGAANVVLGDDAVESDVARVVGSNAFPSVTTIEAGERKGSTGGGESEDDDGEITVDVELTASLVLPELVVGDGAVEVDTEGTRLELVELLDDCAITELFADLVVCPAADGMGLLTPYTV